MLNRGQAMAYGWRIGCRYYVMDSEGNVFGGFINKADAEACRKDWQSTYNRDKHNRDKKLHVEEVTEW